MDSQERRDVIRLVSAAVLVALLLAFVIDNSQEVEIGFLVGELELPLIVVLLATAVIGAIVDRLLRSRSKKK